MKTWTLDVKEDPDTGDSILEFPPDMLEATGWKEGDDLIWTDNEDGSYTLTKKEETQWVLVEAVSTFRERYLVEVPIGVDDYGNDKAKWALDTVTVEEAKVFSSEHIGEQIISHRTVSLDEALKLCDEDNDYASDWDNELKIENFFTTWKEQQNDSNN